MTELEREQRAQLAYMDSIGVKYKGKNYYYRHKRNLLPPVVYSDNVKDAIRLAGL